MNTYVISIFTVMMLIWATSFVVIRKVFLKRKAQLIKYYEEKYNIEIKIPLTDFPESLSGSRNFNHYVFNIIEKGKPLSYWQRYRIETRIKLLGIWAMLFFISVGGALIFVVLRLAN